MKKLETKLAAGVRQAKKTQEPAMAPASTPAAEPQAKPQSGQPPVPVRDDARQNLHPERVWPD
ncbi:MAG: histone H1 protein [Gammaproteobacteria bacterium]